MAVGLSTANLANAWLNSMRGGGVGSSFTAPAAIWLELHTADPGASGTTAVAATSTRVQVTMGAAASGSMAESTTPSWTGAATETITHIAAFSASSAGTFYWSAALTTPKSINSGDTLNLTTLTFALTPLAA
jgi:hypothetical protein